MKLITPSGRTIDPLRPTVDDISLEDIAIKLGREFRFEGNTWNPYSVAQHSVLCADIGEIYLVSGHCLCAARLMHDATEAYIGDMVTPLKRLCPDYRGIEKVWADVIFDRFELVQPADHPYVKESDRIAFQSEVVSLACYPQHYEVPLELAKHNFEAMRVGVPMLNEFALKQTWSPAYSAHRFLQAAKFLNIK